jgi:hypothetical protein
MNKGGVGFAFGVENPFVGNQNTSQQSEDIDFNQSKDFVSDDEENGEQNVSQHLTGNDFSGFGFKSKEPENGFDFKPVNEQKESTGDSGFSFGGSIDYSFGSNPFGGKKEEESKKENGFESDSKPFFQDDLKEEKPKEEDAKIPVYSFGNSDVKNPESSGSGSFNFGSSAMEEPKGFSFGEVIPEQKIGTSFTYNEEDKDTEEKSFTFGAPSTESTTGKSFNFGSFGSPETSNETGSKISFGVKSNAKPEKEIIIDESKLKEYQPTIFDGWRSATASPVKESKPEEKKTPKNPFVSSDENPKIDFEFSWVKGTEPAKETQSSKKATKQLFDETKETPIVKKNAFDFQNSIKTESTKPISEEKKETTKDTDEFSWLNEPKEETQGWNSKNEFQKTEIQKLKEGKESLKTSDVQTFGEKEIPKEKIAALTEELKKLTVEELRAKLRAASIEYADCKDKSELIQRILSLKQLFKETPIVKENDFNFQLKTETTKPISEEKKKIPKDTNGFSSGKETEKIQTKEISKQTQSFEFGSKSETIPETKKEQTSNWNTNYDNLQTKKETPKQTEDYAWGSINGTEPKKTSQRVPEPKKKVPEEKIVPSKEILETKGILNKRQSERPKDKSKIDSEKLPKEFRKQIETFSSRLEGAMNSMLKTMELMESIEMGTSKDLFSVKEIKELTSSTNKQINEFKIISAMEQKNKEDFNTIQSMYFDGFQQSQETESLITSFLDEEYQSYVVQQPLDEVTNGKYIAINEKSKNVETQLESLKYRLDSLQSDDKRFRKRRLPTFQMINETINHQQLASLHNLQKLKNLEKQIQKKNARPYEYPFNKKSNDSNKSMSKTMNLSSISSALPNISPIKQSFQDSFDEDDSKKNKLKEAIMRRKSHTVKQKKHNKTTDSFILEEKPEPKPETKPIPTTMGSGFHVQKVPSNFDSQVKVGFAKKCDCTISGCLKGYGTCGCIRDSVSCNPSCSCFSSGVCKNQKSTKPEKKSFNIISPRFESKSTFDDSYLSNKSDEFESSRVSVSKYDKSNNSSFANTTADLDGLSFISKGKEETNFSINSSFGTTTDVSGFYEDEDEEEDEEDVESPPQVVPVAVSQPKPKVVAPKDTVVPKVEPKPTVVTKPKENVKLTTEKEIPKKEQPIKTEQHVPAKERFKPKMKFEYQESDNDTSVDLFSATPKSSKSAFFQETSEVEHPFGSTPKESVKSEPFSISGFKSDPLSTNDNAGFPKSTFNFVSEDKQKEKSTESLFKSTKETKPEEKKKSATEGKSPFGGSAFSFSTKTDDSKSFDLKVETKPEEKNKEKKSDSNTISTKKEEDKKDTFSFSKSDAFSLDSKLGSFNLSTKEDKKDAINIPETKKESAFEFGGEFSNTFNASLDDSKGSAFSSIFAGKETKESNFDFGGFSDKKETNSSTLKTEKTNTTLPWGSNSSAVDTSFTAGTNLFSPNSSTFDFNTSGLSTSGLSTGKKEDAFSQPKSWGGKDSNVGSNNFDTFGSFTNTSAFDTPSTFKMDSMTSGGITFGQQTTTLSSSNDTVTSINAGFGMMSGETSGGGFGSFQSSENAFTGFQSGGSTGGFGSNPQETPSGFTQFGGNVSTDQNTFGFGGTTSQFGNSPFTGNSSFNSGSKDFSAMRK